MKVVVFVINLITGKKNIWHFIHFMLVFMFMRYLIILLLLINVACEQNTPGSSFVAASTDGGTSTDVASASSHRKTRPSTFTPGKEEQEGYEEQFYVFTNDFYNEKGTSRPYIRLTSKDGESYIIPPLEYADVETQYAVISGFKVKTGCVKVPGRAFPLKLYICDSVHCKNNYYLADIIMPNHYGIMGIGGLFAPQVYPASPCSEEFEQYIKRSL